MRAVEGDAAVVAAAGMANFDCGLSGRNQMRVGRSLAGRKRVDVKAGKFDGFRGCIVIACRAIRIKVDGQVDGGEDR